MKKAVKPTHRGPRNSATPQIIAANPDLLLPPHEQAVSNVRKATQSGKWLIAAFRIDGEQLHLDRIALNFPKGDLSLACRLFVENVEALKAE